MHAVPTFTTAPLLPLLLPPPVLPLPLLPLLAVVVPLPLLAVVVPPLPLPEARSAQTGCASVTGGPAVVVVVDEGSQKWQVSEQ